MGYVWVNGRIFRWGKPALPADDSAYLLGYGVFETLVAHRGRLLFLRDHYQRMKKNARTLGLKLSLSQERLGGEVRRLLKKAGLKEATVRWNLSESLSEEPRFVIIVKPFLPYPAPFYKKGGRLILVRSIQNDPPPIAGIKSTNYLTKMLARKEAKRRGAVEGILLNAKGHVTEGGSSNVFIVKNGRLLTPPLSEGLMPGTRRRIVITLAKKLKIPFREKTLTPGDLKTADEIFITSTLKDILPIGSFEGKKIGDLCPGPVTSRLSEAFERLTA